jgi:hypothetical protein
LEEEENFTKMLPVSQKRTERNSFHGPTSIPEANIKKNVKEVRNNMFSLKR